MFWCWLQSVSRSELETPKRAMENGALTTERERWKGRELGRKRSREEESQGDRGERRDRAKERWREIEKEREKEEGAEEVEMQHPSEILPGAKRATLISGKYWRYERLQFCAQLVQIKCTSQ